MSSPEARFPLPIERLTPIGIPRWHHADEKVPAAYGMWIRLDNAVDTILGNAQGWGEYRPEVLDTLAFFSDAAAALQPLAEAAHPEAMAEAQAHQGFRQERCRRIEAEVTGGGALVDTLDRRTYSHDDLFGIVEAHYGAMMRFLQTGDRNSFWPEHRAFAQDQVGDWYEAELLESMVVLAGLLDLDAQGEEDLGYSARMNTVVTELGTLYARHGHLERAIALFSILSQEEYAQRFLAELAPAMQALHEEYGGSDYYQKLYSETLETLRTQPWLQTLFESALQPGRIAPIAGSRRTLLPQPDGTLNIHETFELTRTLAAVTSRGESCDLPLVNYYGRNIYRYNQPDATYMMSSNHGVDFDELSPAALEAVEQRREGMEAPAREEELDRIVLGLGNRLLVQGLSDEEWFIMRSDPDRPFDDQYVTGTVEAIEAVGEGWLVTDYNGSYMPYQTYTEDDVARIAPPEANAFWFSGEPRTIRPPHEDHFAADTTGPIPDARWVITPVYFYRVEKRERI